MRILVTGHRGHVGGPVARHLADLGYEVVGFDRVDDHEDFSRSLRAEGFEYYGMGRN